MALEDERELVKATKRKNANVVRDLKRQLQNSNRHVLYGYTHTHTHTHACMHTRMHTRTHTVL